MTIQIENEQGLSFDFDYEAVARQVIEQVLDMEQCPYEAEVSVTLTGSQEIRRLNREFRQIDRETDVLSFPMAAFPAPADYRFLEEETADCFHPETGELMLGDIVISKEHVLKQAEAYGHSVTREFAFLIAHSMLHLFGYDHMEEAERLEMEAKQREILDNLNITR